MWCGKTVSIALPTYNEKESIRSCIEGFLKTGVVDEVVVCNNNAAPGTSEEVAKTAAREVFEKRQGYGWSCQTNLAATTGDLIVLCEPDGTFEPSDIFKLLAYSNDFDVVFGSRTMNDLIWEGASMNLFLKWGNWVVAKMMEFLFNTTCLTDVGCTMRLLTKGVLQRINLFFTVGGSHFSPELMLLCIRSGARIIQIPINFKPRIGKSRGAASPWKAFVIGSHMIWIITHFRLRTWFGGGPHFTPAILPRKDDIP
jgi:glycosyltransferase involved in cell wall biosynthesis